MKYAIAFSDKYEYFALIDSYSTDALRVGRCEIGNSLGDFLEYPFNKRQIFLDSLQARVEGMNRNEIQDYIWQEFDRDCRCIDNEGKAYPVPTMNLLMMPFFAELMKFSDDVRNTHRYEEVKEVFAELQQLKQYHRRCTKPFLLNPDTGTPAHEYGISELNVDGEFYPNTVDFAKGMFDDDKVVRHWFITDSARSMVDYVVLHYLQTAKHFKECDYCKRLFIPKYNSLFCQRPLYGAKFGSTCRTHGQARLREKKDLSDPVQGMFIRSYQAHYVRVKRNNISQSDFDKWYAQAKKKKRECLANVITVNEFREWLDQDRMRSRRQESTESKSWEKFRKKCKHLSKLDQEATYCGLTTKVKKDTKGKIQFSCGPCEHEKCPLRKVDEKEIP